MKSINFRPDIFLNYVDEAKVLEEKVIDAIRARDDFYKVVADDMRIKLPVVKKLIKAILNPDKEVDQEVQALLAVIEAPKKLE